MVTTMTLAEKMAEIAIKRKNFRTLSDSELAVKYGAISAYIEVVANTGKREISLDRLAEVSSIQSIGDKAFLGKLLKEDGFALKESKDMHHRKEVLVVW